MRPYGCRGETAPPEGPLAPDLTRATTFAHPDAETLRAVGSGERPGEFYPRYGHPAARAVESAVAGLEGTDGAVSFASGMAAMHASLLALLGAGDTVLAARDLYGYTSALLAQDLPRFGIEVRRFDPYAAPAVPDGTRLVLIETPTNPLCRVVDVRAVADAAHARGALLVVDATFAPPPVQRLAELGADLVVHSATKYLGGHSDAMAGVAAGRHELLERIDLFRRRTGAVLAPESAWLLLRSLKTLRVRVETACANAARLARFLEGKTRRVLYPGLPSHPDHALAARQMLGYGAMLCFEVEGGLDGARRVFDRFATIARAVSLGGVETVASLPVHTSHAMIPPDARAAAGITDGMIRLSVGIEPAANLEADLAQALMST